jgi:hypothetical protein
MSAPLLASMRTVEQFLSLCISYSRTVPLGGPAFHPRKNKIIDMPNPISLYRSGLVLLRVLLVLSGHPKILSGRYKSRLGHTASHRGVSTDLGESLSDAPIASRSTQTIKALRV